MRSPGSARFSCIPASEAFQDRFATVSGGGRIRTTGPSRAESSVSTRFCRPEGWRSRSKNCPVLGGTDDANPGDVFVVHRHRPGQLDPSCLRFGIVPVSRMSGMMEALGTVHSAWRAKRLPLGRSLTRL